MSKLEMKNEVETDEFTDELSDEALDRKPEAEDSHSYICNYCRAGR